MTTMDEVAWVLLLVSTAAGTIVALRLASRIGRFLNFSTLLILNYILVNLVSGLVHILEIPGISRGWFDAVNSNSGLLIPIVGGLIGLVAICIGCSFSLQKLSRTPLPPIVFPHDWLARREKLAIWIAVVAITGPALGALIQVSQLAETSGVARFFNLTGGTARFAFLSAWLVWVVSYLVIWLAGARAGKSPFVLGLATGFAILAMVASLSWNGGRSILLVVCLPLVLLILPRLRGARWVALLLAASSLLVYVVQLSASRPLPGLGVGAVSVFSWIDWEWGRFSMTGFASEVVAENGFMWGETYAASFYAFASGFARFIGVELPISDLRSSTEISGSWIAGTPEAYYIVMGMNAELYLNFGLIGIAFGCLIVGMLAGWVDVRYTRSSSVLRRFALAYLGVLVVFRTTTADSGTLLSYLLYTGAPVFILAAISLGTTGVSTRSKSGSVFTRLRSGSQSPGGH